MSPFMKTVLLWAAIILLLSYMFRLNPAAIVGDIARAVQTVHNSH